MSERDAPFTLSVEDHDGTVTVMPVGELDRTTTPSVAAVLQQHRGSAIAVDLSYVLFADSSFVRALVEERHHARLAGARFHITGASERVRRSFELSGVASLFEWV